MKFEPLIKKDVENSTYLKLCQNRTHLGPVEEEKLAKLKAKRLSAAANKVKLAANFAITVLKDKPQVTTQDTGNVSWRIADIGTTDSEVAKSALYVVQAWENQYSSGTEEYQMRYAKFAETRIAVYNHLGIKLEDGNRAPKLTKEQRDFYNTRVSPFSFDYFEYHVAFKLQGSKKFIRSKTFRSVKPMTPGELFQSIIPEMNRLSKLINIEIKVAN